MLRIAMIAALMVPAGALAQGGAQEGANGGGNPPQRIRSVTLQRGERCPASTKDEVVVCSTVGEPYRIPAPLRNTGAIPAANQSWANRASTAAEVSRVAGGLPDSCSPIGNGGQTGCALARNQEWAAQRRAEAQGTDGD